MVHDIDIDFNDVDFRLYSREWMNAAADPNILEIISFISYQKVSTSFKPVLIR
jgi:hypothetical protein